MTGWLSNPSITGTTFLITSSSDNPSNFFIIVLTSSQWFVVVVTVVGAAGGVSKEGCLGVEPSVFSGVLCVGTVVVVVVLGPGC